MIAPTRLFRTLFLLPVAAAAIAFAAPTALAADHCVGLHPSCASANTYPATPAGLASALTAANTNASFPGADTVYIGPGEYVIPATLPISLSAPMTVIGAGKGTTSIKAGANNVVPVYLYGTGANTVDLSNLTIRHEGYINGYGLTMGAGVAHDLDISVISTGGSVRGAQVLANGKLEHTDISLEGNGAIGVYLVGTGVVDRVNITGTDGLGSGIQSGGATTRTVSETTMRNVKKGIFSDQGPMDVRDLFIDLKGLSGAIGVESENSNNCDTCALDLDARNITVVGSGANQVGIAVGGTATNDAPENGVGEVLNSYFDLTGSGAKALRCTQSGDFATASLNSNYVAAQVARIQRIGTCGGSDTNLLDTTALASIYNMPTAGDYRPATGSPLIDAGMPGSVINPGTEDADGLDRVFDGDNDLSDRIDIGAYEFQPAMKPTVTFTAAPNPVDAGQNVNFNATASDPDGGAVTISWHFGDALGGTGTSVSHAYSSAGDFDVVATATDNEGQSSTATKTVHVNSTPPTTPTAEADVTEAVRGQTITFTASGSDDPDGDAFNYEWTFTGGGSVVDVDGDGDVQWAASQLGNFTATVRAVDEHNEQSAAASVSVMINNRAPAVPTVTKDVPTAFRGETFTFGDVATDPDGDTMSRVWNFGDGVVTVPVPAGNQTHSYSTVGIKTVSVTVADAYGGSNSGSTTVEVLDRAPVLSALARTGGSKVGDLQTFGISASDADGDPVAFSWNFGDGTTGTGPTVNHAYASAGTFSVVATADDGQGAVVTAQTSVTIDPPIIKLTKPTKKIKLGKKANITINASSAALVTFTVARVKAGWVKGKKCSVKKPTPKSKKRCDLKLRGTLRLSVPAGDSRVAFGPRWGGKKLPAGKYRLTASPDQGGAAVSVVVTIL